jgi:hypothetical protein
MRVAALYDIHANLPALEAVLEDVRRAEIDHVPSSGICGTQRPATPIRGRNAGSIHPGRTALAPSARIAA